MAILGGKAWQLLEEMRGNTWRKGIAKPGRTTWQHLEKKRDYTVLGREGVAIAGG